VLRTQWHPLESIPGLAKIVACFGEGVEIQTCPNMAVWRSVSYGCTVTTQISLLWGWRCSSLPVQFLLLFSLLVFPPLRMLSKSNRLLEAKDLTCCHFWHSCERTTGVEYRNVYWRREDNRPAEIRRASILGMYKVVQIWQTVTCLHTISPDHIWTTLYFTGLARAPWAEPTGACLFVSSLRMRSVHCASRPQDNQQNTQKYFLGCLILEGGAHV
jgi:hypothetical protein